ncbi:hypothetical protein HY412_01450 [Candidatus Kaiserbacteria bacterium]|nr:hypothetical protein [Candidatus Kaiserbacteria bacterium]
MYRQTYTNQFWGGTFNTGTGWLAGCSGTICGVGATIINIINNILVPVLFAVAFIVFLWGIYKAYIYSAGDPVEVEKGHKLILWGIVAFVVMISLWGLVNVVANTFGLWGAPVPNLPRSY